MDASTDSGSSAPALRCARTWTSKIRSIHNTASRNPPHAASNAVTTLIAPRRRGDPNLAIIAGNASASRSGARDEDGNAERRAKDVDLELLAERSTRSST